MSIFRTEPIDGIHYVFHACMSGVQLVIFRPGVQLVVFVYLFSIVTSIVVWWRWRVCCVAQSAQEACQDISRLCKLYDKPEEISLPFGNGFA